MAAAVVFGDGALQANPLAQVRTFAALVLGPEAAAWCLLRAFSARLAIAQGLLVLARGRQRLELAVRTIAAVEPWRLPVPGPGASLRLAQGGRWRYGIALADPAALIRALRAGGGAWQEPRSSRASLYAQARLATAGGRLQHLAAKFVLLPLALAVPAFRLHQHIAYGSSFGEYQVYGAIAYLKGFALWWATWIVLVTLCAAVLRVAIEAGTVAALFLRPAATLESRRWLERLGLAALYLGLPAWLLSRMLVA
jgi:apolipoprotein N-acyltransferase